MANTTHTTNSHSKKKIERNNFLLCTLPAWWGRHNSYSPISSCLVASQPLHNTQSLVPCLTKSYKCSYLADITTTYSCERCFHDFLLSTVVSHSNISTLAHKILCCVDMLSQFNTFVFISLIFFLCSAKCTSRGFDFLRNTLIHTQMGEQI